MALVRAQLQRVALLAMMSALGACGRVDFETHDATTVSEMDAWSATDAAASDTTSVDVLASLDTSPTDIGPSAPDADSDGGATPIDASEPDASEPDASGPDASGPDASAPDASEPDASTTVMDDAGDLDAYCNGRIPSTDNAYLPYAECISELDAARIACNADPLCVVCGYTVVTTGVGGTQACNDGGGMTGLRQWICWPAASIPSGFAPI